MNNPFDSFQFKPGDVVAVSGSYDRRVCIFSRSLHETEGEIYHIRDNNSASIVGYHAHELRALTEEEARR